MTNIAELAGRDPESRRFFMKQAAKMTLGVGVGSTFMGANAAKAEGPGGAKTLIYIFCSGGMTHLDTFDPKRPGTSVMGDTEVVADSADGQMGSLIPNLAKHADKMAIINSMFSINGAHEEGQYIMRTGYNKLATIVHPTVGPFAEALLARPSDPPSILPKSVVIGESTSNSGFLESKYSPLPISDPSGGVPNSTLLSDEARFGKRMDLSKLLGKQFLQKYNYAGPKSYVEYYDQATKLLTSDELKAFDISGEAKRDAYGMSRVGQGCLLARRLIENGIRVVEIRTGGFDMHEDLKTRTESVLPPLDQAISTLLSDLQEKGMLDSTIVALGTEFGRTPNINMNGGRDHHPTVYSTFLAGGGVRGGIRYGSSTKDGKKVDSNPVTPEDFIATLGYGLGVPLDEPRVAMNGRPFTFGGKGKPVTDLFG